jgi:hypothetical protein
VTSFRRAREIWRTAGFVYLVQLAVALAFLVGAERVLASQFGSRPFFDRAVGGDLDALMTTIAAKPDVWKGLLWMGLGMAAVYALVSLWLVAILVDALAGARTSRGRIFLAYLRLWLLALVPYAVALGLLLVAFNRSTDEWLQLSVDRGRMASKLLVACIPGILLYFFTSCAVDYARIAIAVDERPRAFRAFVRGVKTLVSRRRAVPQYALYLVAWLAISLIYVGISSLIGSALILLLLRQLTSVARFGARVVTYAGQTDIYKSM